MRSDEIRKLRNERGDILLARHSDQLIRFVSDEPDNGEWQVEHWDYTKQNWVQRKQTGGRYRSTPGAPVTVHSRDINEGDFDISAEKVKRILQSVEDGRQRRLLLSVAALLPAGSIPLDADVKANVVSFNPAAFANFLGVPLNVVRLVDGDDVTVTRESFLAIAERVHGVRAPIQQETIKPDGISDDYWEHRHDLDGHIEEERAWGKIDRRATQLARDVVVINCINQRGIAVAPYPKRPGLNAGREAGDAYRVAYSRHQAWVAARSEVAGDDKRIRAERSAHPERYTAAKIKGAPKEVGGDKDGEYYTAVAKWAGLQAPEVVS